MYAISLRSEAQGRFKSDADVVSARARPENLSWTLNAAVGAMAEPRSTVAKRTRRNKLGTLTLFLRLLGARTLSIH